MNEQQTYVFNQYYIDFLKKLKSLSKEAKKTSKDARNILESIKKNFSTMDKLTSEYATHLESTAFWSTYDSLEDKRIYSDAMLAKEIFTDIPLKRVVSVAKGTDLVHHFLSLLDLFRTPDIALVEVVEVIKVLNSPVEFNAKVLAITDETVVAKLRQLKTLHNTSSKKSMEDELKDIEATSLGKLAKEIMGDINIEEMQQTMNDPNMNIFESMQNPNSGFGKVLSSVSQKMLSKIGSGELQQDVLLNDAINLATKIPNMLPDGMGAQLGNIGAMLSQLQKMTKGGGAAGAPSGDMNPMEMMQQMMGGSGGAGDMNPMEMMQQMMSGMNLNKTQQGAAKTRMSNSMKKQKTASRMRSKIEKRAAKERESKNNIEDVVENNE
jgi:hypothetical protein